MSANILTRRRSSRVRDSSLGGPPAIPGKKKRAVKARELFLHNNETLFFLDLAQIRWFGRQEVSRVDRFVIQANLKVKVRAG